MLHTFCVSAWYVTDPCGIGPLHLKSEFSSQLRVLASGYRLSANKVCQPWNESCEFKQYVIYATKIKRDGTDRVFNMCPPQLGLRIWSNLIKFHVQEKC